MAQANSEIRYLTPPSIELKKKKYCRFKKSGIKYIDYKDPEFGIPASYCRHIVMALFYG